MTYVFTTGKRRRNAQPGEARTSAALAPLAPASRVPAGGPSTSYCEQPPQDGSRKYPPCFHHCIDRASARTPSQCCPVIHIPQPSVPAFRRPSHPVMRTQRKPVATDHTGQRRSINPRVVLLVCVIRFHEDASSCNHSRSNTACSRGVPDDTPSGTVVALELSLSVIGSEHARTSDYVLR